MVGMVSSLVNIPDQIDHMIPEQTEPPDIIETEKPGPKVPGLNVALLIN